MKAIFVDGRADHSAQTVARRPVSAVMSSPVSTVAAASSLDVALRLMVGGRVRHLVVLNDAGVYCGVVSDRDIGEAWAADPSCLPTRTVSSIVDEHRPTVTVSAHAVGAARVMRSAGADAVAVVDGAGSVVGIVTGTDLIGLLARYTTNL